MEELICQEVQWGYNRTKEMYHPDECNLEQFEKDHRVEEQMQAEGLLQNTLNGPLRDECILQVLFFKDQYSGDYSIKNLETYGFCNKLMQKEVWGEKSVGFHFDLDIRCQDAFVNINGTIVKAHERCRGGK